MGLQIRTIKSSVFGHNAIGLRACTLAQNQTTEEAPEARGHFTRTHMTDCTIADSIQKRLIVKRGEDGGSISPGTVDNVPSLHLHAILSPSFQLMMSS